MTDHFASLGESRRPWIDEEELKAKFHALTAEHHPDVAASRAASASASPDFATLNLAYQSLRDPRARLRHLLELEAPELIARHLPAPPAVGELFAQMGAKKQALDAFLKKRAAASSALAKAMLTGEQILLQEELEEWLAVMESEKARWLERIPPLDALWTESPGEHANAASQLAEIAQALGYLDKWTSQIREGMVKLQIG